MRISLVTETYPPEVNGVALTVQSLALGLSAAGHDVSVVRPEQKTDAQLGEPALPELRVPGARLPRYPELQFGLPVTGRLRRFWRRERPDAIYAATEGPLGWAALRAARQLDIPTGTGFHTRFDDYFDHYHLKPLAPLVLAFLRRFHNRSQATIVPTRELQSFLVSRGFLNVRLLRRAVDLHRFDPSRRDLVLREHWGAGADDPVVLYVGRIAPEKNLELAVSAFRAVAAAQPRARFVWVGDGPARARLAQENPDFIFTGVQRGDALARHYASGDLFLFPSLTETFGNVTLEAMASGLATIAFDYGAAREHITDPRLGRAVPRDNPEAFIRAAVELASDLDACRAIGRDARASLAGLDPHEVAQRFAGMLGTLTTRPDE